MTDFKRDNLGFLIIDVPNKYYGEKVIFIDGEKYFFKEASRELYKELVVDELAKDMGINCVSYDIADVLGRYGLISKDLNSGNNRYIPTINVLSSFYQMDYYPLLKQYNNLRDISFMLSHMYDPITAKKLIEQLEKICIFDRLTGNPDRNITNYGFIYNDETVDFVILDNTACMDTDAINDDEYLLKISHNKDDFYDYFSDKIPLFLEYINEDHIEDAFKRVEMKIHAQIDEKTKRNIKEFFNTNKRIMSRSYEDIMKRKRS